MESSVPFNEKFLSLGEAWEAAEVRRGRGEEAAPALLSHSAQAVLPPWGLLTGPLDWAQVGTQCSPPRSQAGTFQRPSLYTLGEGASGCIDARALP